MINETLNEADQKMDKAVGVAREEFAAIRAGRANPSMFAKLVAEYYGTPTPIQQLASFSAQDARTILVAPYDMGALAAIEKAIVVAKDDFAGIRTGRATPQMFNKIVVDYYETKTPIVQLASFAIPEPRDRKSVV